jgi:hypothetical protein
MQSEAELKKPNMFNDAVSNAKVTYDQMTSNNFECKTGGAEEGKSDEKLDITYFTF